MKDLGLDGVLLFTDLDPDFDPEQYPGSSSIQFRI